METLNLGIDGLDDIEQIGRGGSSRVYRATQVELDRPVALKVLKAGDDPNVVRRFDRERKAMGRLSLNEGIVPVYSTGLTDRGEPYLIMPYYENGSLQDRMAKGPVPWEEAVAYVTSAATTMTAAHEAGVVHLDLKPANILLSSDNMPRIADFGIAKLVNDPSTATNTGAAFTPTYSSPEVLLGGAATAASDVYGLAATLWSMLSGRPPFRSDDRDDNALMAVVGRVVHQPIEDLRHIAPDEVCTVVEKGMAKDPVNRYPTAGAFAEALADANRSASSRQSSGVVAPLLSGHGQNTATVHQTSGVLNFEQAVPPRFEPVATNPARMTGTDFGRSWMLFGIVAAALVAVTAVLIAARLVASGTNGTANSSTESTVDGTRSNGNQPGDADGAPNGPLLSAPTTTTEAPASNSSVSVVSTTSATTTPTSGTSEITTVTVSTTETTDVSVTTTDSSATTQTTDSSTSSSSSSSTSSTTIALPKLVAPSGVTAIANDAGSVTISWNPPADSEGLNGFAIQRTTGINIEVLPPVGAAATSFDDSLALVGGETYTYRVRALAITEDRNSVLSSLPGASVTIPLAAPTS